MEDLNIRKTGRAGRITFTREKTLNALSRNMAQAIHAALQGWRDDPDVALVVIDAEGERAFAPVAISPPSGVPPSRAITASGAGSLPMNTG